MTESFRTAKTKYVLAQVIDEAQSMRSIRRAHPHAFRWHGLELGAELPRFTREVADAEMQRQLLITAIAIRRYQLIHLENPAALSSLVPDLLRSAPRDPMDGKPLRYHAREGDSYVLYSIGEDGEDNGGDARPPALAPNSVRW